MIKCSNCGYTGTEQSDTCYVCSAPLVVDYGSFKIGESVVLNNEDHVWHGEIALVRDSKPGFYRLELNGKLLWVPQLWVKEYETG